MEHDSSEKDNEAVGCHGDCHSNEDRVEEDTSLEQGDVHRHALVGSLINCLALLVEEGLADFGTGLVIDDGLVGVLSLLDHVHHLRALSNVLLVEDDEPSRHGRVTVLLVRIGMGLVLLLVQLTSHSLFVVNIVVVVRTVGVVAGVSMVEVGGLGKWALRSSRRRLDDGDCSAGWAAVRVAAGLCVEVELDHEEEEHGGHHDDTGHGGVDFGEEVGETRISETAECCREKLLIIVRLISTSYSWVLT